MTSRWLLSFLRGRTHGGTRARWATPWRSAALVLALCLPGLGAAAACDPGMACCASSGTGSTCGGAGPATQGNDSGTDTGAGNPINLITGNKFQREVDLAPLPGVLGLELVRYYNSADDDRGLLGRGWRLSYETTLRARAGSLDIVQADGTRIRFGQTVLHADVYRARTPLQGLVRTLHTPRGTEYLWHWADGRQLRFSAAGKLEQIRAPSGEFVSLRYDGRGWLLEVIDPAGRRLGLNYLDKAEVRQGERFRGVQSIDTPVGRYSYEYGGQLPAGSTASPSELIANLVKVSHPAPRGPGHQDAEHQVPAHSRLYHHEDPRFPTLLTGISVQHTGGDGQARNERLSTWAYDAARRAVLSVKGERPANGAGAEQVELQWLPGRQGLGKVLLTNSLGQRTVYTTATIAGQPRILQAIGPGCSSCGPGNVRYAYDRLGQLVEETTLDDRGRPLRSRRTERDGYGRPGTLSETAYRHGNAQPTEWRVRYGYAAIDASDPYALPSPWPVLISTPSVIPGKERTVRIDYNAAQQAVSVSDAGFSPVDEQGRVVPQGVAIQRQTSHAYARVNGRSVLVGMDGPLPNGASAGPQDGDVTHIDWDARGDFVTALTAPGARTTAVGTDPRTGRIAQLQRPDGVTEVYTHAPSGQLLSRLQRRGGHVLSHHSWRYDASGQPIENLQRVGERELPRWRQDFDPTGRLLWRADALGVLRTASYDTEGRLLRSRVVGAGMDQQEHYAYDARGRLQRVQDNTGARRELVRDDSGRLIATIDPLGRWTRYEPQVNGLRVVQAANTRQPLALDYAVDGRGRWRTLSAEAHDGRGVLHRVTHQRLLDDFGRELVVDHPDSGREVRRFDAADRLVQARQADGSRVDFSYDLQGRLVQRSVTPAAGEGAQGVHTVRYLYQGSELIGIEAPEQSEAYAYDEHGRITHKTVTLQLNDGAPVRSTTRYRYDGQGRLAAQSLPDGSELQYERNGQGQVVAVHRQQGPWAPFGWGRTRLASELQRDPLGLTHLRHGNGIETRWQRSREGMLARVLHTAPPRQRTALRAAVERLVPDAHAQPAAAPLPKAPGAFGLPREPQALWDSRLLFDAQGNVLVQRQFADSAAARPGQMVVAYDAQDQLAQAQRTGDAGPGLRTSAAPSAQTAWRYHHDSLGNRLLAQQPSPTQGIQTAQGTPQTVRLPYAAGSGRPLDQVLDSAGRPLHAGARRYTWDSLGRLASVTQDGATTRYRYNRLGLRIAKQGHVQQHYLYNEQRQRIAELDAQGRITRQYVWLADQLLAVIDAKQAQPLRAPADGVVESMGRMAQLAWAGLWEAAPVLSYVHANHLGAPVLATDEQGEVVWTADYAPFGQRLESATGLVKTAAGTVPPLGTRSLRLDLRLPGQWEDEESGLHYNDQRYYDPQAGRYSSPDPLGLAGGLNGYAYVGNNPLGFVDPLGLVLFAFDGTGNSDPPPGNDDFSNVRKFFELYNDGARWYMNGVGRPDPDSGIGTNYWPGGETNDLARASTARERVDYMLRQLDGYVTNTAPADQWIYLDIVGFSRGAAMARDFANQVNTRMAQGHWGTMTGCVSLRFLGLWDTVAQFGLNGARNSRWQMAVPADVQYAAHAVALNEHRYLFPSESIGADSASPDAFRITRGFIGSHADIGGSYASGDLSDVALIWMVEQATLAGVKMDILAEVRPEWALVINPLLHNKNTVVGNRNAIDETGDRDVCLRVNNEAWADKCTKQKVADYGPDSLRHVDTAPFITLWSELGMDADGVSRIVGAVNMEEYAHWLKNHYGIDVAY